MKPGVSTAGTQGPVDTRLVTGRDDTSLIELRCRAGTWKLEPTCAQVRTFASSDGCLAAPNKYQKQSEGFTCSNSAVVSRLFDRYQHSKH